jgi:hypothetical protein
MFSFRKNKRSFAKKLMNDIQNREKEESEIITIGKITPERQQKREVENALAENREMMQKKREEQKKEEQKTESQLFIINQAKIKMNSHIGTFKVLNDVPTIQDKPVGTTVEKSPANFSFLDGFQVLSVTGDWQDTGTAKYQDNNALIKKSTLMVTGKMPPPSAPIETGKIEFIDSGQINVIEKINTSGIPVPENENPDFDIKISLCKDGYSTVVPMGILDFENNYENAFFAFEYTLSSNDIDQLTLEIIDENDKFIYRENYVPEVIISASKKENVRTSLEKGLKEFLKREGKPSRIWKWMEVYRDFNISKNDYTKPGHYILFWNGFDGEGIYDSSIFDKKTFRAKLTGIKGEKKKTAEVSFKTEYAEVNWVDVRIDQNNKRIDTTLRVNLKDGGAEGLNCGSKTVRKSDYEEAAQRMGVPNPIEEDFTLTFCDWYKIPQKVIEKEQKEPIKERTKSFEELRDMALEGINKYWSRHAGNIGGGVQIGEDFYEVFVNAKQNEKGMVAPRIIYFTNSENNNFNRSHNWFLSRKLFYKVGYIYDEEWEYREENLGTKVFMETSAHEIGHKLLEDYGGKEYSYKHKGSSTWGQSPLKGTTYPKTGEIDLMKYADEVFLPKDFYERVVLSKEDVIGILWLSKINIK